MDFPNRREEITLEKIDFDWIKEQKSIQNLKTGLQLLANDGIYNYP